MNNINTQPTILIIDDNKLNVEYLDNILKLNGYKTLSAYNAEQAYKIAEQSPFDLVLLDIIMPKINGISVCKHFKQKAEIADIPIIFVTAIDDRNNMLTALRARAVDFINKPFNSAELLTRVSIHLELKFSKENLKKELLAKEQAEKNLIRAYNEIEKTVEERTSELKKQIDLRIKIEEQLSKSEKQFRGIFQKNDAIMLLINPDNGKIIDANNAAVRFYKYPKEILLNMRITDLNTLSKGTVVKEMQKALMEEQNSFIFEHKLADNKLKTVEVHSSAIKIADKILLYSIIFDITEKFEIQQKLKDSEKQFQIFMQNSPFSAFIKNDKGELIFYNKKYYEAFCLPDVKKEMKDDKNCNEIESIIHVEQRILNKMMPESVEQSVIVNGKEKEWLLYKFPYIDDNGCKLLGCIGVDITELNTIKRELEDYQEQLEMAYLNMSEKNIIIEHQKHELSELNATKDKFFSIIAHDLKNPFNSLIGFSELLLANYNHYEDHRRKEIIKTIHENANQGFELLENLLEWSRSQRGKINFNPENFSITKLIGDNIKFFIDSARSKNINLFSLIDDEYFVFADLNMINTVLRNLISNAIKFTQRDGLIYLSIEKKHNYIKICVIDNGVGISTDRLSKVFMLDKSSSMSGTEGEKGTGLGLILCKEFVEKNNGKIEVDSEINNGSKFCFTIPINELNNPLNE